MPLVYVKLVKKFYEKIIIIIIIGIIPIETLFFQNFSKKENHPRILLVCVLPLRGALTQQG